MGVAFRGRRLLVSALAGAAVVCMGSLGMLVTTAPAPISMLIEPFSLLLLPGGFVAMVFASIETRDTSVVLLLAVNFVVYLAGIYVLLGAPADQRHPAGLVARGHSR